jgi:hypothetical protein
MNEVQNLRTHGWSLVAGSLAGLVTMAFHPTGSAMTSHGAAGVQAQTLGVLTHSLAIGGVPLLIFGFLGLHRKLAARSQASLAAMIVFCLAAVCIVIAGVMSGFVAPAVAAAAGSGGHSPFGFLLTYTGMLNQAFAKLYVAGVCTAAILWGASMRGSGHAAAVTGYFGALLGGAGLFALFGGYLMLDIRGFGIFVLINAVWTAAISILLIRGRIT